MIGKSDLFILVVSASLLAVGIYRWQENLSVMSANAQQAKMQQAASTRNSTVASVISSTSGTARTTIPTVTSVQTTTPTTINSQSTTNVVINSAGGTTAPIVISNTPTSNLPLYGSYIVKSGDYLSKIAQRYGTTVETLQSVNSIPGTLIEVGQEIQFPLPAN